MISEALEPERAPLEDWKEKTAFCRRNKIALWNVLDACIRPGSCDHNITSPAPAGIAALIKKHPKIERVLLNGRFAEKVWKRYFAKEIILPAYYVPCTSPLHAAMPRRKKLAVWKQYLV